MTSNPLLGAIILSIGGCSSALCYTPQKKTRGWSWQSYWLAQALVCWLILPWFGAWLTTPHLAAVLSEAPIRIIVDTILLGLLFGVGGTAFGVAIHYLGFSITYAIAIGISCVAGTIFTPLVSGQLASILVKTGTAWVLAGVGVAAIGILVSGLAGWLKDKDLRKSDTLPEGFQLGKGLFFCVLAGVLSAVFGISLDVGRPIAAIAAPMAPGNFKAMSLTSSPVAAHSSVRPLIASICISVKVRWASMLSYRRTAKEPRCRSISPWPRLPASSGTDSSFFTDLARCAWAHTNSQAGRSSTRWLSCSVRWLAS